jgi:KDO2-lipid IV(A) lauroyltransferase
MLGRIGVMLAVHFLKLLALVPYGITARFGDGLGWLLYQIPSRRKRIVHINLGLCFPDWTPEQREEVAQRHFRHAIRSYVERSVQWFGSAEKLAKLIQVESAVDLRDPDLPPTLFLGFHFVAIEAASIWLNYSLHRRCGSLYQPMSNPLLDDIARSSAPASTPTWRAARIARGSCCAGYVTTSPSCSAQTWTTACGIRRSCRFLASKPAR